MSKSSQAYKMRKKPSRKVIDVDKLDNKETDEKKDDGTTIYASGAVGAKTTNLTDKATIPSSARRRARTHHSNVLTVTNTNKHNESKSNENDSKDSEEKKDSNNNSNSGTTVYASGAIQVKQVCACIYCYVMIN